MLGADCSSDGPKREAEPLPDSPAPQLYPTSSLKPPFQQFHQQGGGRSWQSPPWLHILGNQSKPQPALIQMTL